MSKEQVQKKYRGKYISFTRQYNYFSGCYIYYNIKSYTTIHENTTLAEDLETRFEFSR